MCFCSFVIVSLNQTSDETLKFIALDVQTNNKGIDKHSLFHTVIFNSIYLYIYMFIIFLLVIKHSLSYLKDPLISLSATK